MIKEVKNDNNSEIKCIIMCIVLYLLTMVIIPTIVTLIFKDLIYVTCPDGSGLPIQSEIFSPYNKLFIVIFSLLDFICGYVISYKYLNTISGKMIAASLIFSSAIIKFMFVLVFTILCVLFLYVTGYYAYAYRYSNQTIENKNEIVYNYDGYYDEEDEQLYDYEYDEDDNHFYNEKYECYDKITDSTDNVFGIIISGALMIKTSFKYYSQGVYLGIICGGIHQRLKKKKSTAQV